MSTTHQRLKRALTLTTAIAATTTLLAAPAIAEPAAPTTGIKIALPALSGRYPVGTTDLHLVDTRQDPWQPTEKRELMVTVTYPAQHGNSAPRAAWMSSGVATALDALASSPDLMDLPRGTVDWAAGKRQARTNAAVDRVRGDWPVVLFSHGLGGSRELNAGLTDDLASRGYVVVSMSHTREAVAVEFPGNRVVTGNIDQGDDPTRKIAIDTRVADSRFVLDQLARLDRGDNPDAERDPLPRGLAGSLDLDKVGMFGHSYGGYTTGETMFHDKRVDAGINIDGSMGWGWDGFGEIVKHGVDRPFMLVGGDFVDQSTGQRIEHSHADPTIDPTWAMFWPNQKAWKRDLHFDKSTHYSFTDLQVVVPQIAHLLTPAKQEQLVGTIDAKRSLDGQHDYFASYFDLHLKGRDNHLFDGDSPCHPDTRFIA